MTCQEIMLCPLLADLFALLFFCILLLFFVVVCFVVVFLVFFFLFFFARVKGGGLGSIVEQLHTAVQQFALAKQLLRCYEEMIG